jgi:hypothetical protein
VNASSFRFGAILLNETIIIATISSIPNSRSLCFFRSHERRQRDQRSESNDGLLLKLALDKKYKTWITSTGYFNYVRTRYSVTEEHGSGDRDEVNKDVQQDESILKDDRQPRKKILQDILNSICGVVQK